MQDHPPIATRPVPARAGVGGWRIRALETRDLDAVAALQEATILAFGGPVYGPERTRAWARFGVEQTPSLLGQGSFFVAEAAGRVVGISGWSPDGERRDTAWLRYVFVSPEVTRRGIGTSLVGHTESSALGALRPRLLLWSSLNARAFYKSLGYRHLRSAEWHLEDGIEIEYALMARQLRRRRAGWL